jgi:hypothetical protein
LSLLLPPISCCTVILIQNCDERLKQVFPNLVSTTSATGLTPDGALSLTDIDLISPVVSAIQQLDSELTSLSSTVAGFAQSFTTHQPD